MLATNAAAIEACFSAATAEEIFEKLGGLGTEWGDATLATLSKMSPTSVKVTMEAVLRHAKASIDALALLVSTQALKERHGTSAEGTLTRATVLWLSR